MTLGAHARQGRPCSPLPGRRRSAARDGRLACDHAGMPRARSDPVRPGDDPDLRLVRTERWAGLRAGDAVRVEGLRQRSASWTFVAHVRNVRTGEEWVEVVGGRPGSRALRSFRPEQIFPAGGKTRSSRAGTAGLSLADAPRLPF